MPGESRWEVVGNKSKKVKQKNGVNKNSNQKKKPENVTIEAPGFNNLFLPYNLYYLNCYVAKLFSVIDFMGFFTYSCKIMSLFLLNKYKLCIVNLISYFIQLLILNT